MSSRRKSAKSEAAALTRRDFVVASAGAVAGTLAAGALPRRAWAYAGGSDTLKVGLIGCGGRGSGAAVQALSADKGAVLYSMGDALADRVQGSLSELQKDDTIRAQIQVPQARCHVGLDSYKAVIEECDVVLLASTPYFRPAHLRAAVEAGKQVFCEKPVAVDGPGIRHVLESATMAKAKNLSLVCGFCWRYSVREREMFQRLHEGALGQMRSVYTTYNSGGWIIPKPRQPGWTDTEFQLRNWQYFTWLGGDHIVEQAVHAIDWIAWTMKDAPPLRCTAVGGRQVRDPVPETGNVYDHFSLVYEYPDDVRAFHMCRHYPGCPSDNSAYFMGEKGTASFDPWNNTHEIKGPNAWKCDTPDNDMYQQEHDELFASIRAGSGKNDGEWMATSCLLAIMGRMAAYTGQVVTWDQALNSAERLGPETLEWGSLPTPSVAMPGKTKLA
jgi:myo-inositol 2-dehydrogenase / D-chiro-inositol 1-dehydrogenase